MSSSLYPGHPKVAALLDTHIGHPLEGPLPDVPVPQLLDGLLKGLNNCKKNADRRAESAREAARVGQETLARARRRLDKSSGSGGRLMPGLGHDEYQKPRVKDRDGSQRPSTLVTTEGDMGFRGHAEGRYVAESGRNLTPAAKSPASNVRVKRELSASPAPSDISHPSLQTDVDRGVRPLMPQPKKKKRKLAHELSPDIPLAQENGNRGPSPYQEPSADRGSIPPRDREQSVRSSRMDSPLASSYVETGVPSPRPSLPTSASGTGPPKIKLKIGNNKSSAGSHTYPQNLEQPIQHFVNPSLSFSLNRFGGPNISAPSVASSRSLIPSRQPIPSPAPPQPRRQKDVNQDFSIVKNVAQSVQWSTFWSGIETYIRDVGEEDVAMLTFRPDDQGIFDMPSLGKHYQDVWDEEDSHLPFSQATNQTWVTSASMAQGPFQRDKERDSLGNRIGKGLRRAFPKDLIELDLRDERKGPGLLEERVVAGLWGGSSPSTSSSALAMKKGPDPNGTDTRIRLTSAFVKIEPGLDALGLENQRTNESNPIAGPSIRTTSLVPILESQWPIASHRPDVGSSTGLQSRTDMLNATIGETEEGVKRELKHLGLLDATEEIDWTTKEDDEIAAGLRQCQRALTNQIGRNNARKSKLTGLVMDRLAYGGYEKALDGLEKTVENNWLKRSARKMKRQKASMREDGTGSTKRCVEKVPLPDSIKQAMQARRQWIEVVGKPMQLPEVQGRFTGLPEQSIYADLDDLKGDAAGRVWTQTIGTD